MQDFELRNTVALVAQVLENLQRHRPNKPGTLSECPLAIQLKATFENDRLTFEGRFTNEWVAHEIPAAFSVFGTMPKGAVGHHHLDFVEQILRCHLPGLGLKLDTDEFNPNNGQVYWLKTPPAPRPRWVG